LPQALQPTWIPTEPITMSETQTQAVDEKPLFSPVEVEQFESDDVTAGKAIGQMLSLLFLYTVIAMSLVSWWTFRVVSAEPENTPAAEVSESE
jgi:hypothetical protein